MTLPSLRPHPSSPSPLGPVLAVVLDGVGLGRGDGGDAVALARTPTLDRLLAGPSCSLFAHGTYVGMPSDDDMGNSEVGHNTLGAGRVFDQGSKLVEQALADGSLFAGPAWNEVVGPCTHEGTLHFIGLLSDGNVHSHEAHLHAMLRRAAAQGCRRLAVHALLDGRDVEPTSALRYVDRLEEVLGELRASGVDAEVASGGGRMVVTMDRYEADWAMVARGWQAHVHGEARPFTSAREAVLTLRAEGNNRDQFLPAFVVVGPDGQPRARIADGDGVILFNFRGDRAMEISRAFTEVGFDRFDRGGVPSVRFAGMTQYDGDLAIPPRFLVTPPFIHGTVSERLAERGVTQWACSETQKFGHITYFWNGNRSGRFDERSEEYVEVPSDRLPFEERPWMQAAQITDALIAALQRPTPPAFLRVNFANGDMVGHTGSLDATILAVECLDLCLARILPVLARVRGSALITADHGNADQMFQIDKKSGEYTTEALTSHTLNRVPLCLVDPAGRVLARNVPGAGLANVGATLLELLGLQAPEDYRPSLLRS